MVEAEERRWIERGKIDRDNDFCVVRDDRYHTARSTETFSDSDRSILEVRIDLFAKPR